ncbi:MAG TPA: glycosyltransferase family 2 protein [Pirellulales bacterium]|nr:glycosyltransferase family 2 protein [Pirellulales bacterium]
MKTLAIDDQATPAAWAETSAQVVEQAAATARPATRAGATAVTRPMAGEETNGKPYLSVVAPCYNEEANLGELHRRVAAICDQTFKPWELVLVNDGSTDRTWPVMRKLACDDSRVVLVDLSRNFGKEAALTAGLGVARGERVLIVDADLQDPPELLPDMLAIMDDGADLVYGRRRRRDGETVFKRFSAALFYRLLKRMADVEIPLDTGDFRVVNRRALDAMLQMPEHHRFVRGMLSWVGFRQVGIEFDRSPRVSGVTKWPLKAMARLAADAVTSFSIRPLRLALWLSGASGAVGLATVAWWTARWATTGETSAAAALSAVVLMVSAAHFLCLGIIGEYLGRLYRQSLGRPLFVIQEIIAASGGSGDAADETIVG